MCASMLGMRRSLSEYSGYVGEGLIEEITRLAWSLEGSRILHLNVVPSRPHVSDTLNALIPLLRDVGIVSDWRTVPTGPRHIELNRALNLALDGHFVPLTARMHSSWLSRQTALADLLSRQHDFVVVHGPELVGIVEVAAANGKVGSAGWIWHCHSDLTHAQPDIRDLLMLYARQYHRTIICTHEQGDDRPTGLHSTVPPTIDPLSPRNCDLSKRSIEVVLKQHGLDPQRPFVLHALHDGRDLGSTSRVADGFLLAKRQVPGLQLLALVKGEENDQRTMAHYCHLVGKLGSHNDMRLVAVSSGIGNVEINAFQRACVALLESSYHEAPATDVLEAMWKGRPIVVGAAAAGRLGAKDGRNVCVADSAEEYGNRIVSLIESPEMAQAIGTAAKKYVREKFLITSLLHAYLILLRDLGQQKVEPTVGTAGSSWEPLTLPSNAFSP